MSGKRRKYLLQSFIVIRAQLEEHLEQEKACRAQIQEKEQQIQEQSGGDVRPEGGKPSAEIRTWKSWRTSFRVRTLCAEKRI